MPRIRTLKPEHRQHRKVGPWPDRVYRLFVSMILEADDDGRFICDASHLRAVTWPYHPKVTVMHVEEAIQTIAASGMLRLYEVAGIRYAVWCSWGDHQKISHPYPSIYPSIHDSRMNGNVLEHSGSLLGELEGNRSGTGIELEGNNTLVAAAPLSRVRPSDGFAEFWKAWPSTRQVGKADALKAWRALSPDPTLCQTILAAVEASKQRPDWQREGGRYIPHPHRWLGKRRWEDAPPAAQATLLTEKTAGNLDAGRRFVARMAKPQEAT